MEYKVITKNFGSEVSELIKNAKKTIDVCVFDWRWYGKNPENSVQLFNMSVSRACSRGVKVRALVNNDDILNNLRKIGVDSRKFISKYLLHTKLIIIDGETVITGSHNYTQSAFCANYELSVILTGLPAFSEFSEFFNNLWQGQEAIAVKGYTGERFKFNPRKQ